MLALLVPGVLMGAGGDAGTPAPIPMLPLTGAGQ